MIQLRHLGGVIARKGDTRSSILRNRRAKHFAFYLWIPSTDNFPQIMAAHAEGVFRAVGPWLLARGPLNWIGEGSVEASSIRSVFPDDEYAQVARIKQPVDPANHLAIAGLGIC